MSDVVFDGVTKRFGDVAAVDDMSLHIRDGEFMVVLGPSGCGKTTALRMIAGLEDISSGVLSIGGTAVNDVAPVDRDIAMVFQSYALYPHMTVRKNMESPLVASRSRRVDRAEVDRLVDEAASMLDLGPYLDRKPGELSGGQRQRVALARAIVRRPKVFLMDEPLSNLDAKLRTQTRAELVQLHRRLGTTLVYVTHDQVEAMTMADRIAVMCDGRLQQVGHPQAVYENPANTFVAGFIGTPPMNMFPATARVADGATWAEVGGAVFAVGAQIEGVSEQQPVIAGVRPEHLDVAATGGIPVTVTVVESLGHERHLVCDHEGEPLVVRQPADAPPVAGGDEVHLVPSAPLHLFDPETTLRIGS